MLIGNVNERKERSLQGRSYMWEEVEEFSVHSQTCTGTKSANSKCHICSSSLLLIQKSSRITSQLLHSEPSLALQQLPKESYLHGITLRPVRTNRGT